MNAAYPPPMPMPQGPVSPPPESYLVWGILVTLLCCLPLGIVSIVKAASVNSLWYAGDHAGAHRAAQEARTFAMWGGIVGGIAVALYLLAVFAPFGMLFFIPFID